MKLQVAVLLVFIALLALSWASPAAGATPTPAPTRTPSPTLLPIPASPTSIYGLLRNTPTPYTIVPVSLGFSFGDPGTLADEVINLWKFANHDHVLDLIMVLLVAVVGMLYVVRTIFRSTKVQD